MFCWERICPALNRANARIRAETDDTAFALPVAHPPSRRSQTRYYVPSIGNHGLTVITTPPVILANRASAPETRQKHVAMTHYAPVIDRRRLLIPSRKRTAIMMNPASAPREPYPNPRQEPPPRAALQVDNCTLSTVEHQGYGQGSVEAPVRADPSRGIGHAREPRRCHALGLTVDNVPDVIYCKAARGRQGEEDEAHMVCAGYA